jgi:hypothetical protein
MKKVVLYIILIFTICRCGISHSADHYFSDSDLGIDSLYNEQVKLKTTQGNLTDCDFAKINANIDFENNEYSQHSQAFSGYSSYVAVLRQDYNVHWYFQNDLFTEEYYKCYDSIMSQRLINKYNYNIFKRAICKADSLSKTDKWIKDVNFPGGSKALLEYIKTKLSDRIFKRVKPNTRVLVKLEIDTVGNIVNPIIFRGSNKEIEEILIPILKKMPKWELGYLYGKPIRQTFTVPVLINTQ